MYFWTSWCDIVGGSKLSPNRAPVTVPQIGQCRAHVYFWEASCPQTNRTEVDLPLPSLESNKLFVVAGSARGSHRAPVQTNSVARSTNEFDLVCIKKYFHQIVYKHGRNAQISLCYLVPCVCFYCANWISHWHEVKGIIFCCLWSVALDVICILCSTCHILPRHSWQSCLYGVGAMLDWARVRIVGDSHHASACY